MRLRFWRGRRLATPPEALPVAGSLATPITHRQFLKILLGTVGGAGLGLAGAARLAEADYLPGSPSDTVNTNLTVQGNLIVTTGPNGPGNMGIGRPSPAGKLDVGGDICINGTQVIGQNGVVKQSYYAS